MYIVNRVPHAVQMHPWNVLKRLGLIPFGMLMAKFACKKCHEKLAVVLPWYAPTPRAWPDLYKPETTDWSTIEPESRPKGGALHYKVFLWDAEENNIECTLAQCADHKIGEAAFEAAVSQLPRRIITMQQGMQRFRHSSRPAVKLVK